MLKKVWLACLSLLLPGFLFFVWQFWKGQSMKVDELADRAIRNFSGQVYADTKFFEQTLLKSEMILDGLELFNEQSLIGLPPHTYDWESFDTSACSGKITRAIFESCFRYSRPALSNQRNLGFLYTWLRIVKDLTPAYYQLVFNEQITETGINMSPDIKGYHWLEFDNKQVLFFYKFSEKLKQGFSVIIDPIKLWQRLNLSEMTTVESVPFLSYQKHPKFSGMRFVFEPDIAELQKKVKLGNYLMLSLIICLLSIILTSVYVCLKLFLGELQTLGNVASEWLPGKGLKILTEPKFGEVQKLLNMLRMNSELVLEQSNKFSLIRKLQSIKPTSTDLLTNFRQILKDTDWNPIAVSQEALLVRDFQGSIKHLLSQNSKQSFMELVNQIFHLKQILITNQARSKEMFGKEAFVEIAAKTQELLLKSTAKRRQGSLQWDVRFLPGRQVSGDFFLVSHQLKYTYFCVADVAGKGLPAGLFAARIKAALDALIGQNLDLVKVFEVVNKIAYENKPMDSFCTCFMGRFNHYDYELEFCSAGHNRMCLLRDNSIIELSSKGLPFGLIPQFEYPLKRLPLKTQDRIILFSDGCVELENAKKEIYSSSRFKHQLISNRILPTSKILDKLLENLQEFRSGVQQADDITLLVIDV